MIRTDDVWSYLTTVLFVSRPQVLVLTGAPMSRQPLVDFAVSITKNIGLLVCGDVILVSLFYSESL